MAKKNKCSHSQTKKKINRKIFKILKVRSKLYAGLSKESA